MPKRKNPMPIYPNLETAIVQKGILKKDIAAEIGINARTLSSKLIGEKGFWLSEALAIRAIYFPEMSVEFLFKKGSGTP